MQIQLGISLSIPIVTKIKELAKKKDQNVSKTIRELLVVGLKTEGIELGQ